MGEVVQEQEYSRRKAVIGIQGWGTVEMRRRCGYLRERGEEKEEMKGERGQGHNENKQVNNSSFDWTVLLAVVGVVPLDGIITYVPILQIRKLKSRETMYVVGLGPNEQDGTRHSEPRACVFNPEYSLVA